MMNTSIDTIVPHEYYDHKDSDNTCILCDSPNYSIRQVNSHFGFPVTFRQCQCGMIKQTPMPNEKFFEWFFNSDLFFCSKNKSDNIWGFYDYFKDEKSRLTTSGARYKKLKHVLNLDSGLSIMKIGPATGTFLHVAQLDGQEVLGSDISDRFSSFAKENYNVDINIGRFEKLKYKKSSFDMVVLFNVIENIPNLDEFLTAVHKTLKPGGSFVINHVPMHTNLIEKMQGKKYFMYRPPICYMFSKGSINRLMEKHGFQLHKSFFDFRYMTPEKILSLLGFKRLLKIFETLHLHRINIPIWAYPSRISVFKVRPHS